MALLVFLDLDGCLRRGSAPKYQLEAHLVENLERFLSSRGDDLQIVITSSWKDVFSLDEIRSHFPPALRLKIVGTTPTLTAVGEHQRHREIRAYLKRSDLEEADWIAIDDQAELFPPGLDNLILCDPEEGLQNSGARWENQSPELAKCRGNEDMNEEKKGNEKEERVYLEDVSGKPSHYRLMAMVEEHLRHAIENRPEELVIKTMGGPLPSPEEIKSRMDVARAWIWRDDPILGKTPSATLANLLYELREYARAARDIPDAIQKMRPIDPSVFERAWINELFGILVGLDWMLEMVHVVEEREARARGMQPEPLPSSFREKELEEIGAEVRPARDKLTSHYFGNLRGQLTIHEYFQIRIGQYALKHAHEVIDRSIDALWDWHEKNGDLIEKHLTEADLKGKNKRKTKAERKRRPRAWRMSRTQLKPT